jgi:YVTN family beta-propeller protein
MDRAVVRMHAGMQVKRTGDPDRDFARMMIPHHQGAIEMARVELQFGHDERLRRLAQEIVVTQTQEIAVLQSAVGTAQSPSAAAASAVPISARDRVYSADQFSNTVSVVDPSTDTMLGVIRLGDSQPANMSPLYRGQLLVHGLGFSPDHRTLAVVSIGSNSVSFIDTATNAVKHVAYVGRSPHEAFFTPDGRELWVSVRGADYIAVLDARTYKETARMTVPNGPGMTIFSPDGAYGYVCSSFTPETVVISTVRHEIVGRVKQESPFCPNIAAAPDGSQVWFTLKDTGKVMVFNARPPFNLLKTIDSGPITNHVNVVRTARGQFAYVTVGGRNEVHAYRTDTFERVATIPVGDLPHGVWPSGDGSRIYVGIENGDAMTAIDTLSNNVVATIPVGQAPQAVVYVPGALPPSGGAENLQAPQLAASAAHLQLGPPGGSPETTVALFDQGLTQILQAAVTGLAPRGTYLLALSADPNGVGTIEPLANFVTNPAGAAVVNAVGPIRQVVHGETAAPRRYLVIAPVTDGKVGAPVQVQR